MIHKAAIDQTIENSKVEPKMEGWQVVQDKNKSISLMKSLKSVDEPEQILSDGQDVIQSPNIQTANISLLEQNHEEETW